MNYFEELNVIDVSSKTEKKNGLTYLSWAWAWGELKKKYPLATYRVYEREDGINYFTDGRTCWVKVSVTIPVEETSLEHIEMLPVMDFRNRSIPLEQVTSMDVNKAIQRALTKAIARHGLGLYIYAGEDLPEEPTYICGGCGKPITAVGNVSPDVLAKKTTEKYGKPYCMNCINKMKEKKE